MTRLLLPPRLAPLALWASAIALLLGAGAALAAEREPLPRPPQLEPNVRLWTRIYSEIDGNAGLIHDSRRLDVVYEVVRFPKRLSTRSREKSVERAKSKYRAILQKLARGERSGLSEEERRVLSLWPREVSNATLREASRNLRFQLGQSDRFREGLIREGAWRQYIEGVFAEHGLPPELAALPHVESSYNPKAYSRVGAAGLWQFTRSTGQLFMRVDHVVDERMDPFAATVAAARLLSHNYRELQAWPLAITAYNHGVGGMRQAVRTLGTRDFGVIAERYSGRTFGFASRNFYAEFLAASDVDRDAERYFGPLHPDPPVSFETVELDAYYPASSVARALGVDADVLRELNPSLRPSIWNGAKYIPHGFDLRVPAGSLAAPAPVLLASIPDSERMADQHRDTFYTVRRGDTLSRIARRHGVRERELVALNNLRSRHTIHAGQVLRLPDGAVGTAPAVVRVAASHDGVYHVRRGDTLSRIARRFGISEGQLVAWNALRNRHTLSVGQRLVLREPQAVAAEPPVLAVAATAFEVAPESGPQLALAEPSAAEPAPVAQPAVAEAAAAEFALAQPALAGAEAAAAEPALAQPATVAAAGSGGPPPTSLADPVYGVDAKGRITVQADETLGHYADWLGVSAGRLRSLNGLRGNASVAIGARLRIDTSRVSADVFLNRRLEYHRTLEEDFFGAYQVTGTADHVLEPGESLWYLAYQKFNVPVWLLRQYNPDLDFGALAPGQRLIVPRVEPRQG
jgi:membrane-bound lytic murein transglycosylase D